MISRLCFTLVWIATLSLGISTHADTPVTSEWGQLKTIFVPAPAEEGVRRIYGIATDSHGRVVAANGRVLLYDGLSTLTLPVPGGGYTGAVAVDAQDRIWIGNHDQLGYFEFDSVGQWIFHSVREALPEAARKYELLWAVHCIGDTVYFVASQQVMEWRAGAFQIHSLPNNRRLFSTALGGSIYVWQRLNKPEGQLDRTPLWELTPNRSPQLRYDGLQSVSSATILTDKSGTIEALETENGIVKLRENQPVNHSLSLEAEVAVTGLRLSNGDTVIGSTHSGLHCVDSAANAKWSLSTSDQSLPDDAVEAITLASDGRIWAVTPQGLVGVESQPQVTYWYNGQGWVATVNGITRWDGKIHLATSRNVFHLEREKPGHPARWVAHQRESVITYDVQNSPALGLMIAGQGGGRINGPWNSVFSGAWLYGIRPPLATGRSVFHPPGQENLLVYADLEGVILRQKNRLHPERPWPVVWSANIPNLDRAIPGGGNHFFTSDSSGRIQRFTIEIGADGLVKSVSAPERLTPETGLGRVVRVEWQGNMAVAYTREQAWSWRPGEPAFSPLQTDAPLGLIPAAMIRSESAAQSWVLAVLPASHGNQSANSNPTIVYGLYNAEVTDGKLRGLNEPPVCIVEGIGWLSAALAEPGVWWLGGTGGLARLELRDPAPLRLTETPLLLRAEDGSGQPLNLRTPVPLAGVRQIKLEFSYPQNTHPLPVSFQTRLQPLEDDWSSPTPERMRSYTRLPGGNYHWAVRAVDSVGNISPELNWDINITRTFVETWYFSAIVLLSVVVGGVIITLGWTRQLRRRKAELEHIVSDRTAALLATNNELRSQNQKRVELIGAVSHELRTPLAGAYMMAEKIVATRTVNGGTSDDAEQLRRCLAELRNVLDGTLDISRYELGLIPVNLRWVSLAEIVRDTAQLFRPLAEARGLTCETELAEGPRLVLADQTNLRRILTNVISNAVKYTETGGVKISLRWTLGHAPLYWAELTVRDTGRGMSAENVAQLFGGFQRVGLRTVEMAESAGLGLALTKRLIDIAGGTIECHSTLGSGSEFKVRFPVIAAAANGPTEPPFALQVLLVEDEAAQRDHATELLEPLGATVVMAKNRSEAIAAAAAGEFALALVDFNLPDGTGLELLHDWRASGRTPARVVMVTSHRSESIRDICLTAGFAAVRPKPLSILAAVEELMASQPGGNGLL